MHLFDRVRDTTETTGTGDITLDAAPPVTWQGFDPYETLRLAGTPPTLLYAIVHRSANEWEVGYGIYFNTDTLVRIRVLSSSNSNAAVNFSAGVKDVTVTLPAEQLKVYEILLTMLLGRPAGVSSVAGKTDDVKLVHSDITDFTSSVETIIANYSGALLGGFDFKSSCRVATTANITLSGLQTIDGVSLTLNDRVLVKNQTDAEDNGIYNASSSTWTRSTDADTSSDITSGLFVAVTEGTANGDTAWLLTTNDPITLGTTELTFTEFGTSGSGSGDFVGPSSSTNNALVVFDGTTGKLGKNSAAVFDASGNLNITSTDNTVANLQITSANTGETLAALVLAVDRASSSEPDVNDGFAVVAAGYANNSGEGGLTGMYSYFDATITGLNRPTRIEWHVTPHDMSTTGGVKGLTLTSDLTLLVANAVRPTANADKEIILPEKSAGTSPTMSADTVALYAMYDGTRTAPYVKDESGNAVKLINAASGTVVTYSGLTNGQIPIGSTSTGAPVWGTIIGSANQVIVTSGSNSITLTLPQSINTNSAPTFAKVSANGSQASAGLIRLDDTFSNTNSPDIYCQKARSGASPSNNDGIGGIRGGGYNAGDRESVGVSFFADGTWGSSDYPGRIELFTTPDGSGTKATRLSIRENGSVLINTTSKPTANGTGVVVFGAVAGTPTLAGTTAAIYAEDVSSTLEMRAMDSAGNVSTFSPHAKDAPEWLYDRGPGIDYVERQENVFLGEITFINQDRKDNLFDTFLNGEELPSDPLKRQFKVKETYEDYNIRTGFNLKRQDWEKQQKDYADATKADHDAWVEQRTQYQLDSVIYLVDKEKFDRGLIEQEPQPPTLRPEPIQPYQAKEKPEWLKAKQNKGE